MTASLYSHWGPLTPTSQSAVGDVVGNPEGDNDGLPVGCAVVGIDVGSNVGLTEGSAVGVEDVGETLGPMVVGDKSGDCVGDKVGDADGADDAGLADGVVDGLDVTLVLQSSPPCSSSHVQAPSPSTVP